jgi:hypothetical protein
MVEKVRPSKRKLTSRQGGRQARVVRNGRTRPAMLSCFAYYHVVHLHVMAKVVWNVAERIESKASEEERRSIMDKYG